jgi:ATP-binding protein involved in chromosome partitioning
VVASAPNNKTHSDIQHIVAVGSCKGGVGKTTTAVNLAFSMRRLGLNVGLFDADLYGPNLPLMFGQKINRGAGPMRASCGGSNEFEFIPITRAERDPYIKPLIRFGLKVMSMGMWFAQDETINDPGSIGAHMMIQTLRDVMWGSLDVLVVDLPPGTGEPQQTFLKSINMDGVIVVTTMDAVAQMDTIRSLKLYRDAGIRILGTVENMSSVTCPNCGYSVSLMDRESSMWNELKSLTALGRIPFDQALGKPIDTSHPLTFAVLDSQIAKSLLSLAENVMQKLREKEPEPPS